MSSSIRLQVGVLSMLGVLIIVFPIQAGWTRTYGGEDSDWSGNIQPTSDGNYAVIATTESFVSQPGKQSAWLLKINPDGDTLWTRTYEEVDCNRGSRIITTSEGGYIIVGKTYTDTMGSDLALVKTDSNGDVLWNRFYGREGDDIGGDIQKTDDMGFIVIGELESNQSIYKDIWLLRLDSVGDTLWTKTYGNEYDDYPSCLLRTDDGGYLVTGSLGYEYVEGGYVSYDIWILRIDSLGDTLWTKTYGFYEHLDWGGSILPTNDGNYLMSGSSAGNLWLLKLDSVGDTLWTRTYEGGGAGLLQPTYDEGYILTGQRNEDLWLVKINSEADTLWTQTFGGDEFDAGSSGLETDDRGFIIVGVTHSFSAGRSDLWLIKTDSLGNVAVTEHPEPECDFEVIATVGREIVLRYNGQSPTPCIEVFDALGRKVDEVHLTDSSGTVTWGQGQSPGVYFIRPITDHPSTAHKVVLIK